jgi:spore germination cell wall hydrolase CwlJ-like protein
MIPSAKTEIDCLAKNIYFEAGNQSDDGKLAVALVTMNRVHSKNFAGSICDVVKEKSAKVCQFSWWCDGKSHKILERKVYEKSQQVAMFVYLNYGKVTDITRGATFYHTSYVKPSWKNLNKTISIGQHIFYKPKKDNNHDEQTEFSIRRQFQSQPKFVHVVDGRYLTPVL